VHDSTGAGRVSILGIRRTSIFVSAFALFAVILATPNHSGSATAGLKGSSILGVQPSASLASPDFNGDGFGDLAVGVVLEDVGTVADAGSINVLYGTTTGLSASSNQFWNQNSPGVEDRAETDDWFGTALAAGDYNGDGFADLAIGAASEGLGAIADAGAVHVLYGSAVGLSATITPDQFWTQDSPDVEENAEQGDEFGNALAAGDFNGDGFVDLAIGVPHESVGISTDAGGVNVLYGSTSGLSATFVADQFWSQDTTFVEDGAEPFDEFGVSLAAADFAHSTHADLAIGVWQEDIGPVADAGAVNVIYGSTAGLSAVEFPDQFLSQDTPNVEDAAEQSDEFGFALAGADFGLGVKSDLAIGVPGENILTRTGNLIDAGGVNVLYGGSSGISTTGNQFWSQNSPNVEEVSETGDAFGQSLAAGDFGNSTQADLAIGSPNDAIGVVGEAGCATMSYGSLGGPSAPSFPDQFWSQDSPNVEDTAESQDVFGCRLAAIDFGNSLQADLAIGVLVEDVDTGSGTVQDAGAVNVLYGSPSGLSADMFADQFWDQDNTSGVAETGDHFGWQLAP